MLAPETPPSPPPAALPLMVAADLQDNLMVASNDLERLQRLLDDAGQALMTPFTEATQRIEAALQAIEGEAHGIHHVRTSLGGALTALQFHDMATQLIGHTTRRLRNCADRLARDTMSDDEDGPGIVEDAPQRPNPVTQDEMDAGSIELF